MVAMAQNPVNYPDGTDHSEALPLRLSPSRANDYITCPRMFYYKTICGMYSPPSEATIKGNLAHAAFERIFDHPAGERTAENAVPYIAQEWERMCSENVEDMTERDAERHLENIKHHRRIAPEGSAEEAAMLAGAEKFVRSWFDMERVNNFDPTALELPDGTVIDGREVHLSAELNGLTLHGFVDRLDRWEASDGTVHWSISDYKTGKVPADKWVGKYWLQLRIYAMLAEQMWGIRPTICRLVFVASGDRDGGIKTLPITEHTQTATRAQVEKLWKNIRRDARTGTWKPTKSPLCNWCYFQDICPAWNPHLEGIPVTG